jgi:hypothetical protein
MKLQTGKVTKCDELEGLVLGHTKVTKAPAPYSGVLRFSFRLKGSAALTNIFVNFLRFYKQQRNSISK